MQELQKNNKSIYLSWLIAYLSILLIPLLISCITYYVSAKVLEKEINRANESLLNQVQKSIDANFHALDKLSVELNYNENVQSLLKGDIETDVWRRYDIIKLVQDLKIYKISNAFINDIFIFFMNNDLIITPNTSNNNKTYYEVNYETEGMSQILWNKLISQKYNGKVMRVPFDENGGDTISRTMFIRSLPILEPDTSFANIGITLNDDFLKDSISNIQWLENGSVFIINSQNEILFSSGKLDIPSSIRYEELTQPIGFIHKNIGNEKIVAAYIPSQVSDWKYVSVIPASIFWEKAEYVRRLTIISVVLCLSLGGLAVLFFLRRNYKPINELTREFAFKSGIGFNRGMNEISIIRDAMSKTLKEKEFISSVLEQQKAIQLSNFIYKLLKGRLEGLSYIHESLSFFDINFTSDFFVVLLIDIRDINAIFIDSTGLKEKEKLQYAYMEVSNVIIRLINQKHQGFTTEIDGILACLVNLKESDNGDANRTLCGIVSEAQAIIIQRFSVDFTVAISDVHSNIFGIQEAYREAVQAMEYKLVMGDHKIISYNETYNKDNANYYYPLEIEQRFINYIRMGEFGNANETLKNVFNNNFESTQVSVQHAKYLIFDIISTILKLANEIHFAGDDEINSYFKQIDSLIDGGTLEEIRSALTGIVKKACEQVVLMKVKQNNNKLIEQVVEFIKQNYMQDNLNISMIADAFHISPDYLSKQFKNQTDESMLDFINKVRIKRSKELLAGVEKTIQDIAEETGFSNVNTYIRIFKKIEGITPGQYRTLKI